MLYKFDILFKKILANGGVKVVTYSQLLENPNAFGEKETLEGAIGELSVVKEGTEKGFSVNSLLLKYHSQMIGRANADIWVKEFPLVFSFADSDDVNSVKSQVIDEYGKGYSPKVESKKIEGEECFNIKDVDSLVIVIPVEGYIEMNDGTGISLQVAKGETALVMSTTDRVEIQSKKAVIIYLTLGVL